jgi:hypothetical protein
MARVFVGDSAAAREGGMNRPDLSEKLTLAAARVRAAMVAAGATEEQLLRFLTKWCALLDDEPDTTDEERAVAQDAAALGFGFEVRETRSGLDFRPVVKH